MGKRSATIVLLIFLLGATAAVGAQQNNGNPFAEIWAELTSLGARVAALEGGGGGGGGFEVVDSTGAVVGQMATASSMFFEVDGIRMSAAVVEEGFQEGFLGLVYEGADCSGSSYISLGNATGTPLVVTARIVDGVGYYPGPPAGFVDTASRIASDGSCLNHAQSGSVAPALTFDPDDVGAPPFALR